MALVWEPNPLAFEHNGFKIYHVYKEDMVQCGTRDHVFATHENGNDDGMGEEDGVFDVRNLDAWKPPSSPTPLGPGSDELFSHVKSVIRKAIDSGELEAWEGE